MAVNSARRGRVRSKARVAVGGTLAALTGLLVVGPGLSQPAGAAAVHSRVCTAPAP